MVICFFCSIIYITMHKTFSSKFRKQIVETTYSTKQIYKFYFFNNIYFIYTFFIFTLRRIRIIFSYMFNIFFPLYINSFFAFSQLYLTIFYFMIYINIIYSHNLNLSYLYFMSNVKVYSSLFFLLWIL